jgi:hypothetical protein
MDGALLFSATGAGDVVLALLPVLGLQAMAIKARIATKKSIFFIEKVEYQKSVEFQRSAR